MTAPWLREMPKHWREIRLQYLARIETGSRDTVDAVSDGEFPFVVRSPVLQSIDSYSFDTEAILTAGDGAGTGEVFHHMSGKFEVHQRVYVMHQLRGVHGRFLYYYFSSEFGQTVAYGGAQSTVPSLRRPMLTGFPVAVPPLGEQRAIADYLDRETAQIDAFIAKNEELITLLTERRAAAAQSEVEHHVGLGSRLKFHFREIDVRAGSKWEELPLLSVSIHHGVVPRDDDSESSSEASDLSHYKVASSGDIVLNRMRAFQGGLGVAPCTGLVSPDYAVLRPAPDVDPNWLALVMRTPRFVSEMVLRLRGIGTTDSGAVRTPRISVADLGAILVSVPGSTLQAAELHAVATSTTQIEAALLVAKRSVELARERRAALISAAVTGRIDVADA